MKACGGGGGGAGGSLWLETGIVRSLCRSFPEKTTEIQAGASSLREVWLHCDVWHLAACLVMRGRDRDRVIHFIPSIIAYLFQNTCRCLLVVIHRSIDHELLHTFSNISDHVNQSVQICHQCSPRPTTPEHACHCSRRLSPGVPPSSCSSLLKLSLIIRDPHKLRFANLHIHVFHSMLPIAVEFCEADRN